MLKANIFNIQTMSTEDGPGIRTSVFFKGCPMRCLWCQNPEGLTGEVHLVHEPARCIGCCSCVEVCPNDALKFTEKGLTFSTACRKCLTCSEECPAMALRVIGTEVTLDELQEKLLRDKPFYYNSGGGVTFTGGECLLQHEFISAATLALQDAGVHVCIDTCGFVKPEIFRSVVKDADLILYDLKGIDDNLHKEHTGVSNKLVLENAAWLGSAGLPVWVRIPVIPGYTAAKNIISEMARFVRENMQEAVERIDLLGYNDLCSHDYEKMGFKYTLKDIPRVKESQMTEFCDIMKESGIGNITIANYLKGE